MIFLCSYEDISSLLLDTEKGEGKGEGQTSM